MVAIRGITHAWGWRRRLEAGEVTTLQEIAERENVTMPFVSRRTRLAYLSPVVLDRIVAGRTPVALSLDNLAAAALEPWAEHAQHALDYMGSIWPGDKRALGSVSSNLRSGRARPNSTLRTMDL
jgi:hypothetical protein